MAATRIISIHIGKGKTARQCITEQLDYIMNPAKTDGGILVSSYACVPETAADDFMLYRQGYQTNTGRSNGNEVIAYHVRQAFKPGEITPEKANAIGKELAERITDGNHAFVVATHIDKQHIHNHIVFWSTALDCRHKFRDVKRSGKDIMQISDDLCRENKLSVITDPMKKGVTYDKWQGNKKRFTNRDFLRMTIDTALRMQPDSFEALMRMLEEAGCLIRKGAHISIKPPDGQRYIRLDSLGEEYAEDSLRRTLEGEHVHIPKVPRGDYTKTQVKRLIDIEKKLRDGKGKGYQIWAERNNIDTKAQMIIFLKEHDIGSIDELEEQIGKLQSEQNEKKDSIRYNQDRMKEIGRLRKAIRDYSWTKEVYTQYRESGWSPEFYQEHRKEIEDHKSAQAVYSSFDGKMPTLKELTTEYSGLKEQKEKDQTALDELKSMLTDLKHIRYNYEILERDAAANARHNTRYQGEDR